MKMRRPERSPTEGMLTFAVTARSCIAVLSARPDGRRVLVEPIGPRFGSEPPTGSGAQERPTCALPAKRASGTDAHRLGCRSAGCGGKCYLLAPKASHDCRIERADHERHFGTCRSRRLGNGIS